MFQSLRYDSITDGEAKPEAEPLEDAVARQKQRGGELGDGKHLGFRFVLKIESSKGFTDELVIACYWREKEESKMTNLSRNSVEVFTFKLNPEHKCFSPITEDGVAINQNEEVYGGRDLIPMRFQSFTI